MSEPLLKEDPFVGSVIIEAKKIVAEIRRATTHAAAIEKAVATAATHLGVNMLSANEELVQAHRQLCSVLNLAEVKQRASMERLEKRTQKAFRVLLVRAVVTIGAAAGIGGAIGGGIAALLLR